MSLINKVCAWWFEVRRGDVPEVVLNNLYKQTQLQSAFGVNMIALDHGQPKIHNLKQVLVAFIAHRREVVTRRSIFELKKARERAHVLEGLAVALENIDKIITLIKAAASPAEAKVKLIEINWPQEKIGPYLERIGADVTRPTYLDKVYGVQADKTYKLSTKQVQAILDLKLHRLTGLEQDKITAEYDNILQQIAGLLEILSDSAVLHKLIVEELEEVKKQFGDARRSVINESAEDLTNEDLITEENVVVTLSQLGYVKTQTLDSYRAQHRGGRGKIATRVKEEDYVKRLLVANTHDTILCFSSFGKVYWLKVYQIPLASRNSRGRPIVNLLPLDKDEKITTILPVAKDQKDGYVFMATSTGKVKKVDIAAFSPPAC